MQRASLTKMKPGNPAVFECASDAGMHRWQRTNSGAECLNCGLELNQADADDALYVSPQWRAELDRQAAALAKLEGELK